VGHNALLEDMDEALDQVRAIHPFAPFVSADRPTSSAHTREALGWQPRERGLLEDLEKGTYFDH
jgi:hypothetical protein